MNANKIGRNDLCHCGSGLKYKKCHAAKDDAARSQELSAQAATRAQEAAAKAAEAAEAAEAGESADAPPAKGGKGKQAAGAVKTPRPKLPQPHNMNLPRRGAV